MTLFQRVTKTAGTALKTFAATLSSMAVMWAVGEAISAIATTVDNYIHREEKAKEAIEEFNSSIEEQQNNLSSQDTWIQQNGDRYAELAKGVDKYGHNISLTSDEFTEYNNLTKDIA